LIRNTYTKKTLSESKVFSMPSRRTADADADADETVSGGGTFVADLVLQVPPHSPVLGDQVHPSWSAHDHLVGISVCRAETSTK
jgi:hypothetical protein